MGSNGEVLLSYLLNNRMTIILKGTYATDNPLEWNEINNNQIFTDTDDNLNSLQHQSIIGCNPLTDTNCAPSYDTLPIFLDVGGIRISSHPSGVDSISNHADSLKFWDEAGNNRQVYCNQLYTSNTEADSCFNNSGVSKFNELMDGNGVIYPSQDVPNADYVHTGIFFRRIVTGWSTSTINNITSFNETNFDNHDIRGANIITISGVSPSMDENGENGLPQWLPMHYQVDEGQELHKGSDYYPIVLEIRFNFKENLMLHSYTTVFPNTFNRNTRVIAFSDWRINHEDNQENESQRLGGNVLSRSRFFYPHLVSKININNGSTGSTRHYYALYTSTETNRDDNLPYASTPARSGTANSLNHIMPGDYVLECREDSNIDGYPETENSKVDITVPENPNEMTVTLNCG